MVLKNLRIVTWNINSLRIRFPILKDFIEKFSPDIIALQEIKVSDKDFPLTECNNLGYEYVKFSGDPSYHGVAFLSKIPIDKHFSLEIFNSHKRHLAIKIGDLEIHNFYVPAGGDIPDPELNEKFFHKLTYLDHMHDWFLENRRKEQNIILLGDLNVAPFESDVWSSRQLRNVVSHTPVEREKLLRNLTSFGWIDVLREFHPTTQKLYSWWSYRNTDWEKSNRGRRLDHIWASEALKDKLLNCFIFKDARNYPRPSDHVPIILDVTIS